MHENGFVPQLAKRNSIGWHWHVCFCELHLKIYSTTLEPFYSFLTFDSSASDPKDSYHLTFDDAIDI